MTREELFEEMRKLDEHHKTLILSRVYGMFEAHEGIDAYTARPERFFEIVEIYIDEFKKEKQKKSSNVPASLLA